MLFAMIMPVTVPLWVPIIGIVFGLLIVKHAFGPRAHIFNVALAARAFIIAAWPQTMTNYVIDGVTTATPLSLAKLEGMSAVIQSFGSKGALYSNQFFGSVGGTLGETSVLLLTIGGLFLLVTKVIDWRAPLTYLATVVSICLIFQMDVLFNILSGGFVIALFFMVTDYITTPLSKNGRLIFGIGCGLLTMFLRIYSGMPEGVMYSILIMNALTPLIDRWTAQKPFGYGK
jgi:electron transport complex protein RnfD